MFDDKAGEQTIETQLDRLILGGIFVKTTKILRKYSLILDVFVINTARRMKREKRISKKLNNALNRRLRKAFLKMFAMVRIKNGIQKKFKASGIFVLSL